MSHNEYKDKKKFQPLLTLSYNSSGQVVGLLRLAIIFS